MKRLVTTAAMFILHSFYILYHDFVSFLICLLFHCDYVLIFSFYIRTLSYHAPVYYSHFYHVKRLITFRRKFGLTITFKRKFGQDGNLGTAFLKRLKLFHNPEELDPYGSADEHFGSASDLRCSATALHTLLL